MQFQFFFDQNIPQEIGINNTPKNPKQNEYHLNDIGIILYFQNIYYLGFF